MATILTVQDNSYAITAIFSVVVAVIVYAGAFSQGVTFGKQQLLVCSLCSKAFDSNHLYEWHIMSMCETQCMDEECPHREYLGSDHSTTQHEFEFE